MPWEQPKLICPTGSMESMSKLYSDYMGIRLPVGPAAVSALQYHAYYHAMVSVREDYENIVSNYYIPITVRHELNPHIDFVYGGTLECAPAGLRRLRVTGGLENISDYIVNALNNGCYAVAAANEFYLEGRKMYGVRYFRHDILIYGYDSKKREFMTAGYDASGHYAEIRHSRRQMEQAYYSMKDEWEYELTLYSVDDSVQYGFDREKVISDLRAFVQEKDAVKEYVEDFVRDKNSGKWINVGYGRYNGIGCLNFMKKRLADGPKEEDARSLMLLEEQAAVMERALQRLDAAGVCRYAEGVFGKLREQLRFLKLKYLKYMTAGREKDIERLLEYIENIKELELAAITEGGLL